MLVLDRVDCEQKIEEVAALAGKIWRQHYTPVIGKEQVEYMIREFQSPPAIAAQIVQGLEYYLLLAAETAIGYIAVQKDKGLFISKYYILQSQRGMGFGRQAMEEIEKMARQRGQNRLWLLCNKYNVDSLAAYGKMGFSVADDVMTDIGGGFVADDYLLEKML